MWKGYSFVVVSLLLIFLLPLCCNSSFTVDSLQFCSTSGCTADMPAFDVNSHPVFYVTK